MKRQMFYFKYCHKSDIFSLDTLIIQMNLSVKVNAIEVTYNDFDNWDKIFNNIYKKLEVNTAKMNHVLSYSREQLGSLKTQIVINSIPASQFLVKN